MANAETSIKNTILLALGRRPDVYVQNNPVGTFRAMENPQRIVKVGAPGQSDILAVVALEITPEMVGKTVGVAWFIEAKTATGRQRETQASFQSAVERRGALYSVVRSPEDALASLRVWLNRLVAAK